MTLSRDQLRILYCFEPVKTSWWLEFRYQFTAQQVIERVSIEIRRRGDVEDVFEQIDHLITLGLIDAPRPIHPGWSRLRLTAAGRKILNEWRKANFR